MIQVCDPTTDAIEAEVEWLYEDLLELTPAEDVLFIIGGWNENVGTQKIPGIIGKFDLEYKMMQDKG